MAAEIAGLPFWELTFDEQGDPDGGQRDAFLAEVPARGITDVIVFAHGWNNDHRIAMELYTRFFGLLAPQVPQAVRGKVGLAGVFWPSQRWSDEPIPDFAADGGAAVGGGAAAFEDGGEEAPAADPTLDPATLEDLKTLFPAAAAPLDAMAALLQGPADGAALAEFHRQLAEFSRLAAAGIPDDGEGDKAGAALEAGEPRMLLDDHTALFERYRDALVANGVTLDDSGGGVAGFGDALGGLLNGAKEALRQATYWQMKNRAGTVGRNGLGPVLGRLPAGVRVHLVGHSFGARAGLVRPGRTARRRAVARAGRDPVAGSVLPLRLREPAALRRRPLRRAGRHARPDQRPARRLLLQPRRRGGHVLPARVVRGPGGRGRRERRALPLGWDRGGRRAGRRRRAGRDPRRGVALRLRAGQGAEHRRQRSGVPGPTAGRRAQRHRAPGADVGGAGGGRAGVAGRRAGLSGRVTVGVPGAGARGGGDGPGRRGGGRRGRGLFRGSRAAPSPRRPGRCTSRFRGRGTTTRN